MIKVFYCVLFATLCWWWGISEDRSSQVLLHEALRETNQAAQQNDLSVNAEIAKQSYCHVDLETFSVEMEVKLRFTNVSDHTVILSRRIESPAIIRVAKTVRDAEKGDFEYAPNPDYFPNKLPSAPQFGKSPDPKRFVILALKESYESTVISGVFGAVDAAKARKGKGLLAKGDHVLQLGVDTWPYQWPHFTASADVQDVAAKWRTLGHLATGRVVSDFVHFTIPEDFKNPPCKR
jgi:hypothetical protein